MGIMGHEDPNDEMLILFERLVSIMEEQKKIKRNQIQSSLLFKIYNLNRNSMSKMFSYSAALMNPDLVDGLLEKGLVQPVVTEESQKYALTLKGIASCIQIEYGKPLEEQFINFLELSDRRFTATVQTQLSWNEKLASLSLILLASTSETSAILLTNQSNKEVSTEVFKKILSILKKFRIVESEAELKTVARGESPGSALMSRLDVLPRKTNNYFKYVGKGSGYFFDVERDGSIDEKKLSFLFRRVFEHCDPDQNYSEMYNQLCEISRTYSPRFLGRSTNPTISLSILKELREFMNKEIWRLPSASQFKSTINEQKEQELTE
jgi:hypothetical protein